MKNVINFFGLILFIAFLVSFVLFYPEGLSAEVEITCEGADSHCITLPDHNIIMHGENPRVIIR